ncbi:hypothetical protein HK101_003323 [Irineochytrium annulatum]|nr:hypothetical protein HK101_003323 [Irineochytrium annulatum]
MRKLLEDTNATLGEDDIGVTACSDNHIQLCVAMVQLGDMAGVEEKYLKFAPNLAIYPTTDTKSNNKSTYRRTAACGFKLQVEIRLLYALPVDHNESPKWRLRASESLAAMAEFGRQMEGVLVSVMAIGK